MNRLLHIAIILLMLPLIGFSQPKMVLVKELVMQDGVYYYRGEKFTGIGFVKNEKGRFVGEEPIKKGRIHGKRVSYTTNGKVITREKFKQGKGVYRTYHTNDRIKSFGMINGEIKEGVWKYFDRRGMLKAEELWSIEVSEQLEWEKFYKSGKLESELYYKMGILDKEVYYDENGKVLNTN
ncbi:MAG: hypothetical protein HON40_06285 [Flavobacteriales bacterium]|nr:hypothetical protein [Flavobacteriales bacterium]